MKPKVMFIRVSENCNAGCFMCNFAHSHGQYNITDLQIDELLKKMNEIGSYEMVRFTGGEPLLHKSIIDYISKFSKAGYKTSIITNGYLLPTLGKKLATSGLDQIIISIDGSTPEINDNARGLKDGLEHIKKGIKIINDINSKIVFRANTVVSQKNISDLLNLRRLLESLHVTRWSIIPIRPTNNPDTKWDETKIEDNKLNYYKFLKMQDESLKIELLGYSNKWAGETEEEIDNSFRNIFRLIPRKECNMAKNVRFYIPDLDLLVPCNCAAHRINQIEAKYSQEKDIFKKADIMAEWLVVNGPTHCTGCEPLNAYISDNCEILNEDIFKY